MHMHFVNAPIQASHFSNLQVSLDKVEVVPEDRCTTVTYIGTCFEHVYPTHCGCLTHLFANGWQCFHYCTQEWPLDKPRTHNMTIGNLCIIIFVVNIKIWLYIYTCTCALWGPLVLSIPLSAMSLSICCEYNIHKQYRVEWELTYNTSTVYT